MQTAEFLAQAALRFLLPLLLVVCSMTGRSNAQEARLGWQSSNVTQELNFYMPQRLKLSTARPEGLKKMVEGVTAPLYGQFQMGPTNSPATISIVLDEPSGRSSRLFVDGNGNGDFTDDPPPRWAERKNPKQGGGESTITIGDAVVKIPFATGARDAQIVFYRFDKNDPGRAAVMDSIFYHRDYALKGSVSFGDKSYKAMLVDEMAAGDFRGKANVGQFSGVRLLLDSNDDGKYDPRRESYDIAKPFNIGGTTWELAEMAADGKFKIIKSTESVEEMRPAPNLTKGAKAIPFTAKTTAGKTVKFPHDYKGKVVLLDFWATWCGPCIAELPNVLENYGKYHAKGFEILGISLDKENAGPELANFTKQKNMSWPQIYDGRMWSAELARLYGVEGIPFMLLVDGDSGEILAGVEARGPLLGPAIEQALAKKKSGK
jgi:peroxiredoxin